MKSSPEAAPAAVPPAESATDSVLPAEDNVPFPVRRVDTASLKALAHPLRVQILEMLSRYGAQTACSLGELLNESSGSTSYHLRQLAKHDFVREVEGKGTARERWWERPRGAIQIASPELAASPATEEASRLVTREFEHSRQAVLADFMAHGSESLDAEWLHAALISTANARLTADQLARYTSALEAFGHRLLEDIRNEGEQEGARPVQIHLNAFPILGVPASAGSRARMPRNVERQNIQRQNTQPESPERKVP
ncbi:helix-turn-helix domain-containing protein [Arthrobacter sp. SPG23]|uniref:helix-turn-helix domain-containing protein n=1 Tax=Arthrobacter sp. SPG23 TaxID=1610703 RepID=UPI000AF019C4|nr:helix-turn-helix domain-containing protein [Arthrobacter sp. SPG23]